MPYKTIVFCVLSLGCAIAQAATVYIDPVTQAANVGETVVVSLKGQGFAQAIDGGGVNLSFNPAFLQLSNVKVDATTWEFFTTPGTVNNTAGTLTDLTFSSFAGRSGSFSIAQISFQAKAAGSSALTLTESALNPFSSGGSLLNPQASLTPATITVQAVPLPAAVWLWVSAMGSVFYLGKRPKKKL